MTMGRLLENVHILQNVEISQLAMLELKCILLGTRRELYNQKQIENLMAATATTPRSSTPILNGLNGSLTEAPAEAGILDGSMALAQLSVSMVRAQNGGDAEKRRDFFFGYLPGEAAALRYAISQDMLSGERGNSVRMMNINEDKIKDPKPGSSGGSYGGGPPNGYNGANRNGNRSRVERDAQNRPLLPCPLPCAHKVPYGSATYCGNFRKDSKQIKKDKVRKYKMCIKCLKRGSSHTVAECKAGKCRICGGEHNYSLCDHDGGEQKMFNIREEGDKDEDKDQQDPNNGEAEKDAETENMYQQE
jgi:hypothetical protein